MKALDSWIMEAPSGFLRKRYLNKGPKRNPNKENNFLYLRRTIYPGMADKE